MIAALALAGLISFLAGIVTGIVIEYRFHYGHWRLLIHRGKVSDPPGRMRL